MRNELVLRSVYGKVNQTYFIQPCPNPYTGRYPDCVKTVDSNGDMILSEKDKKDLSEGTKHFIPTTEVFTITDGTTFNLDDVVDKAKWEAIKHCNWIAKNRTERDEKGELVIDGNQKKYGVADLYVFIPGEESKLRVSKKQLVHRAHTYIYEDSESNRIKKCKVLGRDMRNAYPADVTDYLVEFAERNPKKVLDLYEGEDWKIHLFILDAIDKGVIRKGDGIYKYEDKMLGGSIESVIAFVKDVRYNKIVSAIKKETYPELLTKTEISDLEKETLSNIVDK